MTPRELRLVSLQLRNFKGIRDFTLDAASGNVSVWGDNATGKTSLFDAWLWLLFDKDSQNRKDFEIKTLLPSGDSKHGFEHEVEGVLQIDGKTVTLRKVYHEIWSKPRGSAEKQFTGHTSDYYIDGVPAKLSEYKAKVAEICDESVFRLLTDPGYFNQVLKWQDRRALLLEVCGDITDTDVIASDAALAQLPEILGDRSLDDHRKVIAARRSEINRELEKIPVRIDEVSQGQPDVSELTRDSIETALKDARAQAQEKHQERARIEAGGEAAEKRHQLRELEAELLAIENEVRARANEAGLKQRQEIMALQHQLDDLNRQIDAKRRDLESNQTSIQRLEGQMAGLRERWTAINGETLDDTTPTICAACGQNLPADKVEAAKQKALAGFNQSKAECLERIDAEGKQMKTEAGNLALLNEQIRGEIASLEESRAGLEAERSAALEESEAPQPVTPDPAWQSKTEQIKALEAEIDQLGEGNAGALAAVDAEINDLKAQISEYEATLAKIEQHERGKQRIAELAAKEKELAAEFERLEKELYLCESFIRAKVGLLENRINSKFKLARFKLFSELVNGGLEETCQTTFQGVPYSDLNHGAQINIGLDVVRTLQAYYGFSAPVWVDNSESVTSLVDMDCQLVRLVVSEADKALRVESDEDEPNLKEVANG